MLILLGFRADRSLPDRKGAAYGKRVLLERMRECEAAALDRLVKAAHVPTHGDGLLSAQPHEPLDQEYGFFAVTVRNWSSTA